MSIKQRDGHRNSEAGGVQARLLATIFGLLVLLGVGVGTNVEFQRVGSIKSTLAEGAKRVSDSIRVNGCVTQTDQTNIANYLSTNGLDPSKVYFNASTSRQSYGSTAGNGAIGYNFPIKLPFLNLHYDLYLEEEILNVNSDYVAGMSSDTSVCLGSFPEFSGTQTPITDLGATPVANVTNPAFPTSVTLTGPDTVTVGQSAQYSGIVNMGATVAPAGTQVEVSSSNGTMAVTTQADGSFNTTMSFPSVGPQLLAAKAGIGSATQIVTVSASDPAEIILTNTSGGGGADYQTIIGTSITIQGIVADVNGNPIPSAITNVTSDTPDVPNQTVKTNHQGAFNLTYTPKSIGMKHITFMIGSAATTASVDILQGTPQTITLQSSVGAAYSSDPLTITAGQAINLKGSVAGLYDSPVAGVTIVIDSPTNSVDNFAPNGTITTDESGNYTSPNIVLSQSGTQKIQTTTAGINTPAQIQVNVNPGTAAQVANLAANPTQIGAGGTVTVTGKILDGYGNPVQTGTAIALVGPDATTNVTTQSGGQFAAAQKVSTPGMATLKVQAAGTTLSGGTVAVNVLPTGAYSLTVNTSASQVAAGGSLTATITLKDNTGTPISGKLITLSESPEPSALVTIQATTDDDGQAVVTIGPVTKVGYESITATMDGVSNVIGTATFEVLPGAPNLVIANVSPSTTQVWTAANPVPLPVVSGTVTDSYANPIIGATIVVSGGYGANVTGNTDANGYYAIAIKPISIGGPFALSFAVTSIYGNYNTIQSNITVTAPIVVPVDKVLAGITIAGQTGTMPNLGSEEYPGWRRADVSLASMSGRVHLRIPLGAYVTGTSQQGGLMGVFSDDANFIPANIKSGVSMFGLVGTYSSSSPHSSANYTSPGTYTFTVPAGVTQVFYSTVGGGAGGGGCTWNSYAAGGGGGGGVNVNNLIVTPGQNITVVVGGGGAGGAGIPGYGFAGGGNPGGNSSFNGAIAYGGYGGGPGTGSSSGGAGGAGGTGGGIGSNGSIGGHGTSGSGGPGGTGGTGSYDNYGRGGNGASSASGSSGSDGTAGRVTVTW